MSGENKQVWWVGEFKNGGISEGGKQYDYTTDEFRLAGTVVASSRSEAREQFKKVVASVKRKCKANPDYKVENDASMTKLGFTPKLFQRAYF